VLAEKVLQLQLSAPQSVSISAGEAQGFTPYCSPRACCHIRPFTPLEVDRIKYTPLLCVHQRISNGHATVTVDNRSISSPKGLNVYYLYSYYRVFCTDINSFTPERNHLTMLYHVAVVGRIHDILMVFKMTNFVLFC